MSKEFAETKLEEDLKSLQYYSLIWGIIGGFFVGFGSGLVLAAVFL